MQPLVARPELAFAALDATLEAAGWSLGAESQEAPLVPGEPHWCEWRHRSVDAGIAYTFNPVVRLRVLAFAGTEAAMARLTVAERVPHLEDADLRRLLNPRGDVRDILLGLFAAGELRAFAVLAEVRALAQHADERVAAAAVQTTQEILPAPLATAIDRLIADKTAHPERSALFAYLGAPEQKRQVLRWFLRDHVTTTDAIDEVLRAAFVDPDPEVRMTAIFVATRLAASHLGEALAAIALPDTTAAGADPRDRLLYRRIHGSALRYLARMHEDTLPADADSWPVKYRALASAQPVIDDMTLLVHALTTPLEPGPRPEPPDRAHWTSVAAVPHWLGHHPAPRQVTPERGFLVAIEPLAAATHAEALALAAAAAARLPTADEWEMAMRGPDGRLYPWGNNLAPTCRGGASPWGVVPATTFEWTADPREVVGGDRVLPSSVRSAATPGMRCAVRLVIDG